MSGNGVTVYLLYMYTHCNVQRRHQTKYRREIFNLINVCFNFSFSKAHAMTLFIYCKVTGYSITASVSVITTFQH